MEYRNVADGHVTTIHTVFFSLLLHVTEAILRVIYGHPINWDERESNYYLPVLV